MTKLMDNLVRWRKTGDGYLKREPSEPVLVFELREALDQAVTDKTGKEPFWGETAGTGKWNDEDPLPHADIRVTMTPNWNEPAWHPQVRAVNNETGLDRVLLGAKVETKARAWAIYRAWWETIFEDFEPENWTLPADEATA